MASEIQAVADTGLTLYAVVRNPTGSVYQTTTQTFVTFVDANLPNYAIAMSEEGTHSGYYVGDFPSSISAPGQYPTIVYRKLGASAAVGDTLEAEGTIPWTGTDVAAPTTGDDLITLAYAKAFANVTSTASDDLFASLIEGASAAVVHYTNQDFTLTNYTDFYDVDYATSELILRRWPVTSLTSVTLLPYDSAPETIDGTNYIVAAYGAIRLKLTAIGTSIFPPGFQTVKVIYSAGGAVPDDVQLACAMLVKQLYQEASLGLNTAMQSEQLGDYRYTRRAIYLITDEIKSLLDPYRNFVGIM